MKRLLARGSAVAALLVLSMPLLAATTVTLTPKTATVATNTTLQFTAQVKGGATRTVTWRVNDVVGGNSTLGMVDANGLYRAPAAVPAGGKVNVWAISTSTPSASATSVVTITGGTPTPSMTPTPTATMTMTPSPTMTMTPTVTATPSVTPTVTVTPTSSATPPPTPTPPSPAALAAVRLLDQTTFGPTQALVTHVMATGASGWLDEQFAAPPSPWPALATVTRSDLVDAFFANAANGQDQLRERTLFALSEVLVIASNKNTNPDEVLPWLQLLSRNAFGNYRTTLRELTLDGSMGKFLDLANSGFFGGAANENYPREVMQLFSMGLVMLNQDGTPQIDPVTQTTIPTYTQTDVAQLAKALTGWTFGNSSGIPPAYANSNYYPGPMLPVEAYHNKSSKTFLGATLAPNKTATQDLDAAIDVIFNHQNVGPFLATRLVRALVTSNPTPGYISRVAAAFNDDGTGVRGDMKAVLRAIFLDPEARNDATPANFGRLRTPFQHTAYMVRTLGLDPGPANQFAYILGGMNEYPLDAPSVFGHYSPSFRIPKTTLFGPEFQIYSASDAVNRANWFYQQVYSPWPIDPVLQPYVALAGNPTALANAIDSALLFGRMTPATRNAILGAIPAMPDANQKAITAVYLALTSGESLVQR